MRPWFVIPIGGALAAAIGAILGGVPLALALGAAAAASVAAARALMGDSPAALAASLATAAILVATLVDHRITDVRHALAIAAFAWTVAELSAIHHVDHTTSPLVAMLPAIAAAILDLAFVALVPIAAARLVTAPWQRPRWVIVAPILGVLAAGLAILALALPIHRLATAWIDHPLAALDPHALLARWPDVLGPFVTVAALAGLATLAGRGRHAQLAILLSLGLALACDLRTATVGASTIATATLLAGLAIGRLAGTIKIPSGQAIVAATIGLVVAAPPAVSSLIILR